jgi:SP family general alpha glucoside:H+ symporter-like MFS transporter
MIRANPFQSVVIESVTKNWWTWLIAKLFAGIGVGSLQATLPVYISEHSPTQLRGFLINAYTL